MTSECVNSIIQKRMFTKSDYFVSRCCIWSVVSIVTFSYPILLMYTMQENVSQIIRFNYFNRIISIYDWSSEKFFLNS